MFTALAILGGLPISPATALPREDADHYEFYFDSSDGQNRMHADVLRAEGVSLKVRQPVILTVSPYTNHSGSTTPTDQTGTGPNPRFYDFLDKSHAIEKGYTYVMVDLPGDGGSSGCNDWGGERERTGVKDAVEWVASQPWSNGKVGLLGKSYDGWTGLMGVAEQPRGLAAVASLEPVYSGYRYIFMNGIRRSGTWPYGASFTAVDLMPGRPSDSPEYLANGAPQAWCYPINVVGQNADFSETGPYWTERNLVPTAAGKTTPVFLTQGFLETNTKWDGTAEYFNGLAGNQNRAWLGQFDHCRAWETQKACNAGGTDERMAVGRTEFIEQLMRFFDEHLKGIKPSVKDPTVEVQDILGRWRAEESWPPKDSSSYRTRLANGSYTDSGTGRGLNPTATQGIWSISKPLEHDAWLSGEPVVHARVDAFRDANLAANVYDVAKDGKLYMISRGVQRLSGTGPRGVTFTMYGQDWPIASGHRIAVLLSSANTEEFQYQGTSTHQPVNVLRSSIDLPFLTKERTKFLSDGVLTPRLESYMNPNSNKTTLTDDQIEAARVDFNLPGPMHGRRTARAV